jgi:hypothetical protein
MKRLLQMIQLLLAMNTVSFRKDREFFDNLLDMMRKQGLLMEKIKDLAKQEGTLLGRIITFPAGDGKCVYIITKVYTKTVQIDWVKYGDGWSDARAGHQALLDIEFAKARVAFEDNWTLSVPKPKIICPLATASPDRIKEFTA